MSYFIRPSPAELGRALASWSWLDLEGKRPYRVTAFADIFFLNAARRIWFLDRLEGTLQPAFSNVDEMEAVLATEDGQDKFLLAAFVLRAEREGLELADGECYDWKISPTLGGSVEFHNIHRMNFVAAMAVSGQLHEQIRNLPPDAKISGFEMGDA